MGALGGPTGAGLLHGLKLVAVAIVAQAVWSMAHTLCPDRERASIAVAAALIVLFGGSSIAQIVAMASGGIAGFWLCRGEASSSAHCLAIPISRSTGFAMLSVFILLLVGLPVLRSLGISQGITLFEAFYRSGALVFGGGHVVLPLLREAFVTPGWVSDDVFLAGYGAAQAIPGPLFTFAAYLGAVVGRSPHGLAGAILGLVAVFMGNDYDGDALFAIERLQCLHDFVGRAGVEISGRLVGEQHAWRIDERACDCDALLLAAGKLAGAVAFAIAEAEQP
jgi:chromate transporter